MLENLSESALKMGVIYVVLTAQSLCFTVFLIRFESCDGLAVMSPRD